VIYGDGARDVRVFGSYFAGCLVLVSYWYIWIGNLGLWVCVGEGGGSRHVILLASTLISQIYTSLSSFITLLFISHYNILLSIEYLQVGTQLNLEMYTSLTSYSRARHATSLMRVNT
jgi:hypothetical protein